jgi:hypothetical protein
MSGVDGKPHARVYAGMYISHTNHLIPRTSSESVRERWLELLGLSYAARRVTQMELEEGAYAVVVPPGCQGAQNKLAVVADLRAAIGRIPEMAKGVRLNLGRIEAYGLDLADDFRRWMGNFGEDIARGKASAVVFVDLAYLEALLLDKLYGSGVSVDFQNPISFFRRGALLDYANVLEAVATMALEGRSLADAGGKLAGEILTRLETYARAFLTLSGLYGECRWKIESDKFLMKAPSKPISLALPYWELRKDTEITLLGWQRRIEELLSESVGLQGPGWAKCAAA